MNTETTSKPHRWPLFGHVAGISCVILLQRYLTFSFDTITMNYFRLSAGAIVLLTASMLFYPREIQQALRQRRLLANMFILALIACAAQFLIIEGLSQTSATLVSLIRIIGIILSIVIACFFFQDEREALKGWAMKIGGFLALVGIAGVILGKTDITIQYSLGSLYTVIGICVASAATVYQKRVVTSMHPLSGGALVTAMMSVIYAPVSLQWGNPSQIGNVPWHVTALLFASGAFGLFVGVGLGFISIRNLGVISHRIGLLTVPLLVGILSYVLLDEKLTAIQMLFGALLLLGCYCVIRDQSRKKPATASNEEPDTEDAANTTPNATTSQKTYCPAYAENKE